jgi:hypothetical protein
MYALRSTGDPHIRVAARLHGLTGDLTIRRNYSRGASSRLMRALMSMRWFMGE